MGSENLKVLGKTLTRHKLMQDLLSDCSPKKRGPRPVIRITTSTQTEDCCRCKTKTSTLSATNNLQSRQELDIFPMREDFRAHGDQKQASEMKKSTKIYKKPSNLSTLKQNIKERSLEEDDDDYEVNGGCNNWDCISTLVSQETNNDIEFPKETKNAMSMLMDNNCLKRVVPHNRSKLTKSNNNSSNIYKAHKFEPR